MSESSDIQAEVVRQAEKKALRLLTVSDRTEHQLREKLREGGFPPEAVDAAVDYVRSFHYIDDRRYAEAFVRSRKEEKSIFEIRMELRKRGVPEDLAEEAMDAAEFDEEAVVMRLFEKKYGRKDLTDPKLYEQAFRYFGSRGFSYEDIRSGITKAIGKDS